MGARRAWACSTNRIMRARAVSEPTRLTSRTSGASKFKLPDESSVPGSTWSGIGSPVRLETSTAESPSRTTPSTGMRSPARSWTRSPGRRAPTLTSRISPSVKTKRAVSGCNCASCCKACPVRKRARSSRKRPKRTKPSNITGSLKKHGQPTVGQTKATKLAV